MKFKLIIDKEKGEEIVATVHQRTGLIDELEQQLPASFIRINKSSLANESALDRFTVTVAGSVDAVFKCGYREYVSRRCFAQIKRRLEAK